MTRKIIYSAFILFEINIHAVDDLEATGNHFILFFFCFSMSSVLMIYQTEYSSAFFFMIYYKACSP